MTVADYVFLGFLLGAGYYFFATDASPEGELLIYSPTQCPNELADSFCPCLPQSRARYILILLAFVMFRAPPLIHHLFPLTIE